MIGQKTNSVSIRDENWVIKTFKEALESNQEFAMHLKKISDQLHIREGMTYRTRISDEIQKMLTNSTKKQNQGS